MSIFETILPNNATAFEKSLEEAANFPQLPIDELADLVNPWKIDARYLPWLAYRFCIEIWQDHWPEEKKRSVIARALELQRIKGTEKGLRDYVKLADGQVKQIVVPPQHFWAGKGLSAAEINAWHETMPQIRIYFVKKRGSARGFSFANHHFVGSIIASPNIGRALYGRSARLWDKDKEQPLEMIELRQITRSGQAVHSERVSISGLAGKTFFAGGFVNATSVQAVMKQPQIITWNTDIAYSHASMAISTTSLSPSLKPLDVRAKRRSEIWHDKIGFTASRFANRFFVTATKAGEKLYDCLVLNDPKRAAPKVQGLSFTNVNILGMSPYLAKALVDLRAKRQSRAFFADDGVADRHVSAPDDPQKRDGIARAIALSKAVRDEILVSFQTSRPINFTDMIPLDGSVKFNSRIDHRL